MFNFDLTKTRLSFIQGDSAQRLSVTLNDKPLGRLEHDDISAFWHTPEWPSVSEYLTRIWGSQILELGLAKEGRIEILFLDSVEENNVRLASVQFYDDGDVLWIVPQGSYTSLDLSVKGTRQKLKMT